MALLAYNQVNGQLSINDYSITLGQNEQFVKISRKQIIDSVNMNQRGPEQFEYLEISLSKNELPQVEPFMRNCRDIQSIIDKFGRIEMDITVGSNSEIIRPLSGFYYAIGYNESSYNHKPTLFVIYPLYDRIK